MSKTISKIVLYTETFDNNDTVLNKERTVDSYLNKDEWTGRIPIANASQDNSSLQKLIIKKEKKMNQKIQLICNLENENDVVQEASNKNDCTEMVSDFNELPNKNHNYSTATSDLECVNAVLKNPSQNTKKKKKKSKVVNSKEVISLKKSNKCKAQMSDKEYSKNDTPQSDQSVDMVVDTYVSNDYIGGDDGKKLEFFDALDDQTSECRTMTDPGMYVGQYCNIVMSNNANGEETVLTGNTPLQCDVCFKTFTYRSDLDIHRRTHTGEKPYTCDICGRAFMMHGLVVRHKRTHTGEKPYECNVCGQSFSRRHHLFNHKRTHTGEKPYVCDVCSRSFTEKKHLVNHYRTHTGEKPNVCNVCGRSYSRKANLVIHHRSHTGERPYECGQCEKKFSSSSECNRHALRDHTK